MTKAAAAEIMAVPPLVLRAVQRGHTSPARGKCPRLWHEDRTHMRGLAFGSSRLLNHEHEPVARDHLHARAGRKRRSCTRAPDLALHQHASLVAVPCHRLTLRA